MKAGKYTLNTGGNCIITAILSADLIHATVSDNFTGYDPVVRKTINGLFNYHGIRYNLREFTRVK